MKVNVDTEANVVAGPDEYASGGDIMPIVLRTIRMVVVGCIVPIRVCLMRERYTNKVFSSNSNDKRTFLTYP